MYMLFRLRVLSLNKYMYIIMYFAIIMQCVHCARVKAHPFDCLHHISNIVYVHVYYVQLKRVSILKKYDEEIEGEKKSSFALGQLVDV